MSFMNFLSKVGKVIGKTVEVGKRVGGFIAKHHNTLAPLAHGLAVASGSEGLQKVTGAGLALSKMATLRQGLDNVNAVAATQRAAGGLGAFNGDTMKWSNQGS